MAWLALFFAGLFEIVWATAMKQSEGFTRFWPTVAMIVGMILSFGLLAWSMKVLPLGTAYTIWTGIGALGAFIIGIASALVCPARACPVLASISSAKM